LEDVNGFPSVYHTLNLNEIDKQNRWPINRNEEEFAGYRDALDPICENHESLDKIGSSDAD